METAADVAATHELAVEPARSHRRQLKILTEYSRVAVLSAPKFVQTASVPQLLVLPHPPRVCHCWTGSHFCALLPPVMCCPCWSCWSGILTTWASSCCVVVRCWSGVCSHIFVVDGCCGCSGDSTACCLHETVSIWVKMIFLEYFTLTNIKLKMNTNIDFIYIIQYLLSILSQTEIWFSMESRSVIKLFIQRIWSKWKFYNTMTDIRH